jgi:adenylosuccinate synthase
MTKSLILLGLQFGDEGKGKIADYLGSKFDAGVRFNGANNAGHTVVVGKNKLPLSHLPSSVLANHPLYIAQGCSINPKVLIDEIKKVRPLTKKFELFLDPRCHVIMPYHILLDQASENYRSQKVGSLKLGVGFSYEDKTNRDGIRIMDLQNKKVLAEKLKQVWSLKTLRLEKVYGAKSNLDLDEIVEEFFSYGKELKQYIHPVAEMIIKEWDSKSFLFESAQAFYLDYSFGTYPFTVAYNTLASSVYTGVGLPPYHLDVLGIVRSYTIRVGSGPFPTEQDNEIGQKLREIGNEYGTVSKRPRRCGWLDLPLLAYSIKMNGVKELALTKIDVLSHFEKIKVCTSYDHGKGIIPELLNLDRVKPKYEVLSGWNEDITRAKKWSDLPLNCQKYIKFIETNLGVPIKIISVGPDRQQTIEL